MKKIFFCICKNPESDKYHIFKCKINLLTRKCYFIDTTSICKEFILSSDHECFIDCMSLEEAREECALMANNGEKICPNCVSLLYK